MAEKRYHQEPRHAGVSETGVRAPVSPAAEVVHPHTTVVEADGVVFELIGSKVFLRGHVRTLRESEAAECAARRAPGVTVVENHVIVLSDRDGPEVSG